jgi:NMD protein affecting ribosome stability and mRNA decay
MKFCPRCGATDKDFYKGFCVDCYAQMNIFAEIPRTLKIVKCKNCGFWFYKNAWIEDSYQNLVKMLSEKVKTVLFEPKFDVDLRDSVAVLKIFGFADERKKIPIKVEKEVFLEFEEKTCDSCLKFSGKNYEVKIQLRRSKVFDAMKYKKIVDFIRRGMNYRMRDDERARSFWFDEKKEGIDFFFGFRQVGDLVLHQLLDNFKVKHETSFEFLGLTKDGKKKVRVTYCIRI